MPDHDDRRVVFHKLGERPVSMPALGVLVCREDVRFGVQVWDDDERYFSGVTWRRMYLCGYRLLVLFAEQ